MQPKFDAPSTIKREQQSIVSDLAHEAFRKTHYAIKDAMELMRTTTDPDVQHSAAIFLAMSGAEAALVSLGNLLTKRDDRQSIPSREAIFFAALFAANMNTIAKDTVQDTGVLYARTQEQFTKLHGHAYVCALDIVS